jgi:maltose 6'-phosphate phosphatase
VSDSRDPYDIHSRKIVMAQVRVPHMGLVNVFSAHLSWPSDGFYPQFDRLQRWAEGEGSRRRWPPRWCAAISTSRRAARPTGTLSTRANTRTSILKITKPEAFQRVFRDRRGDPMHLLADDGRIDYLWLDSGSPAAGHPGRGAVHARALRAGVRPHGLLVEFELR